MRYVAGYNLNGLATDDALEVCRSKRDEALKRLQAAQAEYNEWDGEHARRLASWANDFMNMKHR